MEMKTSNTKENIVRIRNETHEPLVVALRDIKGYDDREDVLEPGQTSDDWLHLEDEDTITIEPSPEPHYVSQVEIHPS